VTIIKSTKNVRKRFEHISTDMYPAGFLSLGDSLCAPNPVYGQGMTMAAIAAVQLSSFLKRKKQKNVNLFINLYNLIFQRSKRSELCGSQRLSFEFDVESTRSAQLQLEKSVESAWVLATSNDKKYLVSTSGEQSYLAKLLDNYFDRLLLLCFKDASLSAEFYRVAHLLGEPLLRFA
jgi:flavin-dependent dehydrogenase